MQLEFLFPRIDKLQKKFGDPMLDPIPGAGQIENPEMCFVYMNPTARNVSSSQNWCGLKAPWIGTKNVWRLYRELGLLDEDLFMKINELSPQEWTTEFAADVYQKISDSGCYITNLAKCTQADARKLPDSVFKEYVQVFNEEINAIRPKVIISFGNQVSSVLLEEKVSVSSVRKRVYSLDVNESEYSVFPVYYPVGQGMRNIGKAIEDIRWIMDNYL